MFQIALFGQTLFQKIESLKEVVNAIWHGRRVVLLRQGENLPVLIPENLSGRGSLSLSERRETLQGRFTKPISWHTFKERWLSGDEDLDRFVLEIEGDLVSPLRICRLSK